MEIAFISLFFFFSGMNNKHSNHKQYKQNIVNIDVAYLKPEF